MPVFAQLFPSMQDRPPHFQPKALTSEGKLPVVRVVDILEEEGREGEEGRKEGGRGNSS